ncbi:MAG: acyl-ACP--UDP-N-acetylglucosamine O-acyltransferase [Gammaproteobacteria bacterium]
MIDPSALVHPEATIQSDVSIGPFSIVEADVVIGSGTKIDSHVVVRSGTHIGRDNHIYSFASIGDDPQFAGYNGEKTTLHIGDNNIVREYVTLNRGSTSPRGSGVTRIGSHNFIMAYSHVAHDSTLGDHIIFANGASLAGHVEVGDYAILGGFSLVHQFCRVGAHALTGIGTVCLKDVPPYTIVAGNPAKTFGLNVRGLRRRHFDEHTIMALKRTYRRAFRNIGEGGYDGKNDQSDDVGRDKIENNLHCEALLQFIQTSERGVIR